jgi:EAL domain-containing protein (putative c-di-GMP-specific phosphodiesterase class I)
LPEQLTRLVNENEVDSSMLMLEITESALMTELTTSLNILTRLRLKGFELSIDDFGTGYSSLSQLHRVPFTELKIDRTFVSGMVNSAESKAIVDTCILLGHNLKMTVIAEGVEDQETFDLLQQMGCDNAQGYFIAKPLPITQFETWLNDFQDKGD